MDLRERNFEARASKLSSISKLYAHADTGLVLSQSALQYGLRMLEKSGTGLQPSIKTANTYERNLLQEVDYLYLPNVIAADGKFRDAVLLLGVFISMKY